MKNGNGMIGAEASGFISNDGPPPAALPAKIRVLRREKPTCRLQIDGWLLQSETLRRIEADLRKQARTAGVGRQFEERDELDEAADGIAAFLTERRIHGERAWR